MIIRSLELSNYRNYEYEKFDFAQGTNVLFGDNAQGKTNALESVFICACGKSYKGTKDKDIIGFDKKEAHIKLIIEKEGVPHRVDIHLKNGGRKGIAIDGVPIKRAVEIFGLLNVVIFAPENLAIIKSSPSERRCFIDIELCQLDKIYTHNLINYNKIIVQKNKLLKQLEDDPSLIDTLSIWNEQLVTYAEPVIKKRREFIEELGGIIAGIHSSITDGAEDLKIIYEPCCKEDELAGRLDRDKARELGAKTSLFGPHRDDIRFEINGIDVRTFGSQGQQRSAALSLKLSEIELVKRRINDTPILLLDDVLSELDEGRQKRLLREIEGIQTIITCTGLDEFKEHEFSIDKTFYIEKGSIKSVN